MACACAWQVDLSTKSVLNEVLWSDPTDSDERTGCHPNARGPNTVSYGPDRVRAFCDANGLKLIMRAHQCVQDGFEWCAHGRLLTVFSAPDYGARRREGAPSAPLAIWLPPRLPSHLAIALHTSPSPFTPLHRLRPLRVRRRALEE